MPHTFLAKHQDLRDRLRMERKIGKALGELVDGLSGAPVPA